MSKNILKVTAASLLAISITLSSITVQATDQSSQKLNEQKNQVDEKSTNVKSEIIDVDEKINNLRDNQLKVNEEIKNIDEKINDTEEKASKKQNEIKVLENELTMLKKEIEVIQKRIEKRSELLKDRARSYQETGSMSNYLDVLLGSMSFGDFINRASAVATIVEADQSILEEHTEDINKLAMSKETSERKHSALQTSIIELDSLKKDLETQKDNKNRIMESLKKEEEQFINYKMELEEEEKLLSSQRVAIQKSIELEKQNMKNEGKNTTDDMSVTHNVSGSVSSNTFTRPTSGSITSGFGGRNSGNHYGVDIAKSGDVPVTAAANGIVIRSYYSSSYGNVVFISHSINGKNYTTVYAHMKNRLVNEGDVISTGEQIGYQGNTGQSFGQHLHFELHEGSWNANKSNAINPAGMVPL